MHGEEKVLGTGENLGLTGSDWLADQRRKLRGASDVRDLGMYV